MGEGLLGVTGSSWASLGMRTVLWVLVEFGPRTSSELWLGTRRRVCVSSKTRDKIQL